MPMRVHFNWCTVDAPEQTNEETAAADSSVNSANNLNRAQRMPWE